MAAIAEHEGKAISDRTIAALAAAKARGTGLGATNPRSRNLTPEGMDRGRKLGAATSKARAQEHYADLGPTIRAMHDAGNSLNEIARRLNSDGSTTRRGRPWTAVQVRRILLAGKGAA